MCGPVSLPIVFWVVICYLFYSINICSGPDGLKYKIVPGKTYREGQVKCLCDVEVRSHSQSFIEQLSINLRTCPLTNAALSSLVERTINWSMENGGETKYFIILEVMPPV